ncbi:MAG: hypothetical protein Q9159_001847 [Coniocarpon cinnabarinum]
MAAPGTIKSQTSPSVAANELSHERFHTGLFEPAVSAIGWHQPYDLRLESPSTMSRLDLEVCLDLVRSSLCTNYKASTWGWSTKKKLREMQLDDMRYLLLRSRLDSCAADEKDISPPIVGFLSFMLTVEDDMEVAYCYEVHLHPELRGQRVGATLMEIMEGIGRAAGMSKSMLTVFTSNVDACKFYERLGYSWYDEEPPPLRRRLRSRTTNDFKPSFLILSKDLG